MTAASDRLVEPGQPAANLQVQRGWPEALCLALYAGVVACMIPYHEPWADEAQAWMLARSLSLGQLFHTYLRFEGQPGLWHLLLWTLTRLHVPYAGMQWAGGILACCGMAVFLFNAPLPRWLKLSVPFSFFFAYQYAVVARNYVMLPLLLFGVAAVWKRKPQYVALLLGLLANVATHAAVIAAGFALAYWIEWRWPRSAGSAGGHEERASAQAVWQAAGIFLVLFAVAVLTAFPTHDVYVAGFAHDPVMGAFAALVWALWDPMALSLAGWLLLVWGFARRRALPLLIPAVALVAFSAGVYLNFWHAGLMVPVILAGLWISWPRPGVRLNAPEIALRAAVAVLVATQIGWAIHAGWYDHGHDYAPDRRTAQFLAPYVRAGDPIAITFVGKFSNQAFHLEGIAPYFQGKIFINQSTPFWWWSRQDRTEADFAAALASQPTVVLAEDASEQIADVAGDLSSAKVVWIEQHGYRLDQTFCAIKPERFSYRESMCYLVFLRTGDAARKP